MVRYERLGADLKRRSRPSGETEERLEKSPQDDLRIIMLHLGKQLLDGALNVMEAPNG